MARVDTLPAVPFPLPDPSIVLQDVWITQGGRDFAASPTRLGHIQQSATPPISPFSYQLWWDTSTLPITPAVLRAYTGNVWSQVGPFGDQNGNVTVPGTLTVTGATINGQDANGDLTIGGKLLVKGGTIGGPGGECPGGGMLTTTDGFTVAGPLTTNGTTTLNGATKVTGGLTTDTLTTSGNATIGGTLSTNTLTITGTGTGPTGGFNATTGTFSSFLTVDGTLTASGGLTLTGGLTGDNITLNGTASQVNLTNGTSNWVQYGSAGVNPPTIGSHSPGTKLLLSAQASATSYDVAIGLQFTGMWFTAGGFYFYGMAGSPASMVVGSNGNLTIATPVMTIAGDMNITGGPAGSGNLGVLTVASAINSATGTLTTNGNFTLGGSGASLSAPNINATNGLIVTNDASIGGALVVSGINSYIAQGLVINRATGQTVALEVNGGLVVNTGPLNVNGLFNISNGLNVFGIVPGESYGLYVQGPGYFAQNITVAGTGTTLADVTVSAFARLNGGVDITGGNLNSEGYSWLNGGCTVGGGDMHVNQNCYISGALWVTGAQITSDRRLKSDIGNFDRGLAAISKLRPVSYRMRGVAYRLHGLIADDLAEAIPEAVGECDGVKTLDPMALIATLINTVRELGDELKTMRNELDRVQGAAR